MVKFPRPHELRYTPYGGDSFQDENGNWVTPESTRLSIPCYAEIAGVQNKIPRQDGVLVEFGWLVYVDIQTPIEVGTMVEIYDRGFIMGKGQVLRYSNGQLGARLWV